MEIKIKDKTYSLIFGFKAIHYLDSLHSVEMGGMNFGQGIRTAVISLLDENPAAILEVLHAGLITEKEKPTTDEIEAYIIEQGEKGQMDKLFQSLLMLFESQPLTNSLAKKTISGMKKATEQATKTSK